MKRYYEKGLIDEYWVREFCHGDWNSCMRYQLEESGRYHEDWMLPDGSIRQDLR